MTQLQPTAGHSTGAPVSPGAHWDRRTIAIVVGALVLMAAAFGLAMWLSSDSETTTQAEVQTVSAEPSSTEIVQAEIDAAIAGASAEASSVEIVQAQIDAALASANVEPSSVAIVQAEIDAALATKTAAEQTASDVAPSHGASGGYDATSFGGTTESVNPTEGYGASGGLDAASFD